MILRPIAILALLFQTQASNTELGYTVTIPEGFTPFPEAKAQNADLVDCWGRETPDSPNGTMALCIQRMHAVLPHEGMKAEDLPAGTELINLKWKTFDIQGLSTSTSLNGIAVFALVAQVPLKPEAIQVAISGPAYQAEHGRDLMTATLASLTGESNWLTASERSSRLGKIAGAWAGIAIGLVAVMIIKKKRAAAQ